MSTPDNKNDYSLIGPIKPVPKEAFVCTRIHEKHPFGVFLYGDAPDETTFALVLLELSFILVITHILHHLLKPFKQPKVISEILVSACTHLWSDEYKVTLYIYIGLTKSTL